MSQRIKVLIADDTEIAREGLTRILERVPDIEVMCTTGTIPAAIRLTRELRPDVVLMDLKWFGDSSAGISAIQHLRSQSPETKIMAMTVYDHLILEARRAGADAAITKGCTADELRDLIRELYAIDVMATVATAQVAEEVLAEPLTEPEKKVLALMAEGLLEHGIANELNISKKGVQDNVTSILRKLGASNRTQAVIIALTKGILEI
jgi:two-component system NarL family response regulator